MFSVKLPVTRLHVESLTSGLEQNGGNGRRRKFFDKKILRKKYGGLQEWSVVTARKREQTAVVLMKNAEFPSIYVTQIF